MCSRFAGKSPVAKRPILVHPSCGADTCKFVSALPAGDKDSPALLCLYAARIITGSYRISQLGRQCGGRHGSHPKPATSPLDHPGLPKFSKARQKAPPPGRGSSSVTIGHPLEARTISPYQTLREAAAASSRRPPINGPPHDTHTMLGHASSARRAASASQLPLKRSNPSANSASSACRCEAPSC